MTFWYILAIYPGAGTDSVFFIRLGPGHRQNRTGAARRDGSGQEYRIDGPPDRVNGTTTSAEGTYRLSIPSGNATLVMSAT